MIAYQDAGFAYQGTGLGYQVSAIVIARAQLCLDDNQVAVLTLDDQAPACP